MEFILSWAVNFFDTAFWQQLLVTIAGLMIGIPFALWINRIQERRDRKHGEQQEKIRREELLQTLAITVQKNKSLLEQMKRDLQTQAIFYNVDLATLDWMASEELSSFDDVALCEQISHLRYELSHLRTKVELQLRVEFDGTLRALSIQIPTNEGPKEVRAYGQMRMLLVRAIQDHIDPTLKVCENILATTQKLQGQPN